MHPGLQETQMLLSWPQLSNAPADSVMEWVIVFQVAAVRSLLKKKKKKVAVLFQGLLGYYVYGRV